MQRVYMYTPTNNTQVCLIYQAIRTSNVRVLYFKYRCKGTGEQKPRRIGEGVVWKVGQGGIKETGSRNFTRGNFPIKIMGDLVETF